MSERKIVSVLLTLSLLFAFWFVPVSAVEDTKSEGLSISTEVDGYFGVTEDGSADITLPDGTEITVDGSSLPDDLIVVVKEVDLGDDVMTQLEENLTDGSADISVFQIYMVDTNGNIYSLTEDISVSISLGSNTVSSSMYDIDSDGLVSYLDSTSSDLMITFTTTLDSEYYVLVEDLDDDEDDTDVSLYFTELESDSDGFDFAQDNLPDGVDNPRVFLAVYMDEDGNEYESGDSVEQSIDLDGEYENPVVYFISTDGTATLIDSTVSDDVITFTVSESGYYVIVENEDDTDVSLYFTELESDSDGFDFAESNLPDGVDNPRVFLAVYMDEDGNEYESGGSVEQSVDLDGEYENPVVYFISTDGTATLIDSTVSDDVITFTVSESGYYVIVENEDDDSTNVSLYFTELESDSDGFDFAQDSLPDGVDNPRVFLAVYIDEDGNEYESGGSVEQSIDLDGEYENPVVYFISTDGTVTLIDSTVSDGVITFTVSESGYYVIAEMETAEESSGTSGSADGSKTGDTSNPFVYVVFLMVAFLVLIIIFVERRKKNEGSKN